MPNWIEFRAKVQEPTIHKTNTLNLCAVVSKWVVTIRSVPLHRLAIGLQKNLDLPQTESFLLMRHVPTRWIAITFFAQKIRLSGLHSIVPPTIIMHVSMWYAQAVICSGKWSMVNCVNTKAKSNNIRQRAIVLWEQYLRRAPMLPAHNFVKPQHKERTFSYEQRKHSRETYCFSFP